MSVADEERARTRRADRRRRPPRPQARKLELARNRLKYTVLRASRSGVVTAVRFEVGQVVAEGLPVVAIADPGDARDRGRRARGPARRLPEGEVQGLARERTGRDLRRGAARAVAAGRGADAHLPARLKPSQRAAAAAGRDRHAVADRAASDTPVAAVPAAALTQAGGQPAVWVVQAAGTTPAATVELVPRDGARLPQRRSAASPACRPASWSSPPACRRWRPD